MKDIAHLEWEGMGTRLEVIVGPGKPGEDNHQAAEEVKQLWEEFNRTGSRFNPDSEIEKLNRDRREVVPVSPMLQRMVGCALRAARKSHGLLDPTLVPQLRTLGYQESWDARKGMDLHRALELNQGWEKAEANPKAAWRKIEVGEGWVKRPVGAEIEIGATGKGLAADIAGEILSDRFSYWTVNCGGDLKSGGYDKLSQQVEIKNPLTGKEAAQLLIYGAMATSGITGRVWEDENHNPRHHLINPKTGKSAWSGLIQVSAAAPNCSEAERLAGQSLLAGPEEARRLLAEYGGLTVDRHGQEETIEAREKISASKLKEIYG